MSISRGIQIFKVVWSTPISGLICSPLVHTSPRSDMCHLTYGGEKELTLGLIVLNHPIIQADEPADAKSEMRLCAHGSPSLPVPDLTYHMTRKKTPGAMQVRVSRAITNSLARVFVPTSVLQCCRSARVAVCYQRGSRARSFEQDSGK